MKKSDKAFVINAIYYAIGVAAKDKANFSYSDISFKDVNVILYKLLKYFPEEFVIMYAKHPVCLQAGVVADIEGSILSVVKEHFAIGK